MTAESTGGNKSKGQSSSSSSGGISSAVLENRLSSLREKSDKLSQTLTKRLATSQSGQNLLHIGPSLSTLPPDLHSLSTNLEPLLEDVREYETKNSEELRRVVGIANELRSLQRRSENARNCADTYRDLVAAENFVKEDYAFSQKSRKSSERKEHHDDDDDDDDLDFLERASSLERTAHATLHLIQELKRSTEQTSAVKSPKKQQQRRENELPSMNESLPQDTEKARFLMKLSPRIRRLESDVIKCLIRRFEIVLRSDDEEEEKEDVANGTSDDKGSSLFWKDVRCSEKEKNLIAIGHCLRGLALLGRGKEAENAFARVAIMPLVRSKLSVGRLDEGGSRGECAGLSSLLDEIVRTVRERYGAVLRSSEGIFHVDASSSSSAAAQVEVDLVTAGVWVPVATALMADPSIKTAVFSPGIAKILQANYTALDSFLSELAERLLKDDTNDANDDDNDNESPSSSSDPSIDYSVFFAPPTVSDDTVRASQRRVYAHPMTAEFSKKWNLPIYYQLRFGDRCARLNVAVDTVRTEGWNAVVFTGTEEELNGMTNELGFELPVFAELYDTVRGMWEPDVVLRPLAHRFLRGSLQLVGRVVAFVREGMEKEILFGAVPKEEEDDDDGNEKKRPVVDTRYAWSDRIEDVAAVAWELTVLESCLRNEFRTTVVEAIAPESDSEEESAEELRLLVSEVLAEASDDVGPLIEKSWNEIIVDVLIKSCCGPLSAVKGVAATYRMTNRPPPTQASPYVSMILRPLKEFDDEFSSRVPPQIGNGWKERVVDVVSDRYRVAVEELLETVRRTEAALQSRRSARRGATTGGPSDGEKVKLQLLLDYKRFASEVANVGADVSNVEGLTRLAELTVEAETLIST